MHTPIWVKIGVALGFSVLILLGLQQVANIIFVGEKHEQHAATSGDGQSTDGDDHGSDHSTDAPSDEGEFDLAAALAEATPNDKSVKKCNACHTYEQGGGDKIGPNLWNIVGQPKAAVEGFSYSASLSSAGGNWSYDELFAFLSDPKGVMPGTKMTFAGLKKPAQAAAAIAYMRTLSDAPIALPEAIAVPEEVMEAAADVVEDGMEAMQDVADTVSETLEEGVEDTPEAMEEATDAAEDTATDAAETEAVVEDAATVIDDAAAETEAVVTEAVVDEAAAVIADAAEETEAVVEEAAALVDDAAVPVAETADDVTETAAETTKVAAVATEEVVAPVEEAVTEAAESAATATEDAAASVAAMVGDPIAGVKVSKKCATCHTFDVGGGNKVGPNLWGIVGSAKGSRAGYKYSAALAGAGGTWTEADLDAYSTNPRAFLPGTKMTFAGIKREKDRANLVAFLKTLSE